jgi:hypothetical protein
MEFWVSLILIVAGFHPKMSFSSFFWWVAIATLVLSMTKLETIQWQTATLLGLAWGCLRIVVFYLSTGLIVFWILLLFILHVTIHPVLTPGWLFFLVAFVAVSRLVIYMVVTVYDNASDSSLLPPFLDIWRHWRGSRRKWQFSGWGLCSTCKRLTTGSRLIIGSNCYLSWREE